MNTSGTFLTFLIFMPSTKDKETGERKRKLQKVLKIRKSTNIMTSLLLGPKDAVRSALSLLDRPTYGVKKLWNCCEFFKTDYN